MILNVPRRLIIPDAARRADRTRSFGPLSAGLSAGFGPAFAAGLAVVPDADDIADVEGHREKVASHCLPQRSLTSCITSSAVPGPILLRSTITAESGPKKR